MDNSTRSLTRIALLKFKKNFWGVFSLGFIVILMLLSIFAYLLAPDNSENANWGDLTIRSKKPGFEVKILSIPLKEKSDAHFSDFFFGKESGFLQQPISKYSIEKGKLAYTLYNDDPKILIRKEASLEDFPGYDSLEAVAADFIRIQKFYLGTDKAGRDYLSRMLVGSRVSIAIGFVAVLISLVVGIFFGALGGY
ncbi:MAG TPA: ABC transporter permease, partial [Flavobacterium sp.]|nr:ABC transporter permease [Flavobacterium sp.]